MNERHRASEDRETINIITAIVLKPTNLFGLVLIITPHCNCNLHSFHSMNLNWIFQLIEQHCLRRSRIIAASERWCYKDVSSRDCYHQRAAIKIFQSVLVLHLRATLCLSRIGSETAFDKARLLFCKENWWNWNWVETVWKWIKSLLHR